MIIKLEGAVCEEMVDALIQAHNETPPEEDLEVYFSSEGGSADDMEVLINIINESEKISMLNVYSIAYSAGFILPMRVTKYVNIMDGCLGMMHRVKFVGSHLQDNLKVSKETEKEMKLMSDGAKKILDDTIALGIFTTEEEKKIRKGEDVFFSTSRMREMREVIWNPIQADIDEAVENYKNMIKEENEKLAEENRVESLAKTAEDAINKLKKLVNN